MKIIAILLIIISITKLYLSYSSKDLSLSKDLLAGIPIDEITLKQIMIAIIVADGLIGLLSGLFILCL